MKIPDYETIFCSAKVFDPAEAGPEIPRKEWADEDSSTSAVIGRSSLLSLTRWSIRSWLLLNIFSHLYSARFILF